MNLKTGNIFAALDSKSKSKSKTTSSTKDNSKKKKSSSEQQSKVSTAELEKALFSAQPQLSISNWADDSEDEEHHHQPVDDGWSRVPVSVWQHLQRV